MRQRFSPLRHGIKSFPVCAVRFLSVKTKRWSNPSKLLLPTHIKTPQQFKIDSEWGGGSSQSTKIQSIELSHCTKTRKHTLYTLHTRWALKKELCIVRGYVFWCCFFISTSHRHSDWLSRVFPGYSGLFLLLPLKGESPFICTFKILSHNHRRINVLPCIKWK